MRSEENYRNLSEPEITVLKNNGCYCGDWNMIGVREGFDPSRCINVSFSGVIRIGELKDIYTDDCGVAIPCGITNARIHNCDIGSNVVIKNIGDHLANYTIEDRVIIKNCDNIETQGVSSFGNGTEIAVLNESCGRRVKIWDRLSAHEAYIVALYRHRADTIDNINRMVDEYARCYSSERGVIGYRSTLSNCGTIHNVRFGPFSQIEGPLVLSEGSVNSCEEDHANIGPGVIMDHFIVSPGSVVTESAIAERCFIGQGTVLGKQYSAVDSLFFSNCELYHGEACSLFAGPYTVSHHKSTLLIACLVSFMNAGSGSNQSNHMYRLGPLHQGIIERGSKTASGTYLLWPSHIGAFTIIKGDHGRILDTSSFPFSYLIGEEGKSILVPGITLKNTGTIRDILKWPQRERRRDPKKTDKINISLFNPCIADKLCEGKEILLKIRSDQSGRTYYSYNNLTIKKNSLERGIELYQAALDRYIGNVIIRKLEGEELNSDTDLKRSLGNGDGKGRGKWVDMAGLIVPQSDVDLLLNDIESGKVSSLTRMEEYYSAMVDSYHDREWDWISGKVKEETGICVNDLKPSDLLKILERWKRSIIYMTALLEEDAGKEFSGSMMTGYGIDGGEKAMKEDFRQVRGDISSIASFSAIMEQIREETERGNRMMERISKIV